MSQPAGKHVAGKAFPSGLDKSTRGNAKAEATLLGRRDQAHGVWTVEHCQAVRGEPMTDVTNKIMFAPTDNDDKARAIRAHELMHAKVSPDSAQMAEWVKREMASATALTVVEELRVNFLCQQAGIDVKKHLADGSELASGQRCAETNDWAMAVAMCVGTAGSAGHKQFLNGVRRVNRAWGDQLLDIGKRAVREMKKAHRTGHLANTTVHNGLAPFGFTYTEQLAEWVDRLASFPPPKERKQPKPSKGKAGGEGEGNSLDKSKAHSNEGEGKEGEGDKDGNPLKDITPSAITTGTPKWGELRLERMPMPRYSKGGIGKKRIATNAGRRPRRMQRMMTDPAMRVFDRKVRGSGGMVVIDASGSMSFTTEQIAEIIEHAPGATVLLYSDRGSRGHNAWVVGDKGRMVETVEGIDYGHGNGVDYPAIQWGVKNRKDSRTPLVWVTDGGVCGVNDSFHDSLAMQCLTYARKNNYIVVPHVEEAIKQLKSLSNGGTARSVYPAMFRDVWRRHMGKIPLA